MKCNAKLVKIEKYHKTYLSWRDEKPTFRIVIEKCGIDIVFEVCGELKNAVKYATDDYMLLYLNGAPNPTLNLNDTVGYISDLIHGFIIVNRKTGEICANLVFRDEVPEFLSEIFRELGV